MVKTPRQVLKEVYVRETSNERIDIKFNSAKFRNALVQI